MPSETMRKKSVKPDSPQMEIRRMRFACWINKATDMHSEYVILVSCPQQQWLFDRALMLLPYVHCLSCWSTTPAGWFKSTVMAVRYSHLLVATHNIQVWRRHSTILYFDAACLVMSPAFYPVTWQCSRCALKSIPKEGRISLIVMNVSLNRRQCSCNSWLTNRPLTTNRYILHTHTRTHTHTHTRT